MANALAATSLLSTKLFIPHTRHLQGVLARPRLVERLKAGLARKLTLLSAPAGYGKTVLLAQWIPNSERSVCWLSLDEADNDLTRFLTYFVTALQVRKADFGQTLLAAMKAPPLPPIEELITALVNEIMQTLDEVVLILDDYHLIQLQAIHSAVAFLVNHLPPNLHLIITSRADPPLPLARLRVRGQMTELRAADLRFTLEEAMTFFQQVKALPLPVDQIQELEARTEGWSAGLHLAALSMHGLAQTDMARFINDFTGSHYNVFDYLAAEVLQQQTADVQQFLLYTALMNRLCAGLCDAILADAGPESSSAVPANAPGAPLQSQAILEYLEHANLFLVPLDGRRQWYRYHHLFADFLRDRLRRARGMAQVNELYQRASGWFEEHILFGEAIDYALAGQDFERAARLVDEHRASVQAQGELGTLLRWLTALPASAFAHRPALAIAHAFSLAVTDQFTAAEQHLDAAERALHAAPHRDSDLLGQAAVVRAAIALQTDLPAERTLAAGRQALALLPEHNVTWRGLAALFLGVGYYAQAGDITASYQTLVEAEQICLAAHDRFGVVNVTAHQVIALEIGGQLRASERISRADLRRATESYWQGVPLAAHASFALSRVLYERNELLTARAMSLDSIQQLNAWVLKRPQLNAMVGLARVQHALGERAAAHAVMADVVAIVQHDDLKQTYSHWAEHRVRMALAEGDRVTAAQWAKAVEPTIQGDLNPAQEFSHITLASVYWTQGRLDEAQRLLDQLLSAAEAAGRFGRVIEILLLQAVTAVAQGQRDGALSILEQALTRAEPEGYIRTFVDLGPPMAMLLHAARTRTSQPQYVAKLLANFPTAAPVDAPSAPLPVRQPTIPLPSTASHAPTALIEPLSAREREILHLLAQGLTNPEIAQQIYISDQTVKVHTRNIYGKLGVSSRKEAVAKAKALGLLT